MGFMLGSKNELIFDVLKTKLALKFGVVFVIAFWTSFVICSIPVPEYGIQNVWFRSGFSCFSFAYDFLSNFLFSLILFCRLLFVLGTHFLKIFVSAI